MSFASGRRIAALLFVVLASPAQADVAVPAPGTSSRIDAIRKSGTLRVGVLANAPWLVENTTGQGDPWADPRGCSPRSTRSGST